MLRFCVLIALFTFACQTETTESQTGRTRGVTDTEIVIGSWGPQTGPAAPWGSVCRGSEAYFKMINEQGGIHGRKIRFIYKDDGYQPPRTRAVVKEMVERDGVFAFVGGVGTATGMAVRSYLVKQKVPWVSPSSGSSHWAFPPEENIFATYPLYCDEGAVLADYAVSTLKKTRVAFFYQNDDYGKGGLIGAKLALAQHDLDLVAAANAEMMDTDLTSQVLRLRESGAEVVIAWVLPKQAQILLGTSARLGFQPRWMVPSTLSDNRLMHEITGGKWSGVIYAGFGIMDPISRPHVQEYVDAWQKYAPAERWGPFFWSGFTVAEPLVEALRRCGPELTYERFIEAMESLNGFTGSGAPLYFGPNQRQGRRALMVVESVSADEIRELTGWVTSKIDPKEAIERLKRNYPE